VTSVILIATIGFTIDFIARRVADLGRSRVKHVIAVGLQADEQAWIRVEQAFKLLSSYLAGIGVSSELRHVAADKHLVRRLRDTLAYAAGLAGAEDVVEAFITGGPRILGLALTIAALTSSSDVRRKVKITAYGENFEATLEVPVAKVASIISLEPTARQLFFEIAQIGEADARTLMTLLGLPKSTLYKKLRELESVGLIRRSNGRWIVHSDVENLI